MKVVLLLLVLFLAPIAQAQNSAYVPSWLTLVVDQSDGTIHEVDINSVKINYPNFSVVTRVTFSPPRQTEDGHIVDSIIMMNVGNCDTRQTKISKDAAFNGSELVSENNLSKDDKLEVPEEGSIHSMLLKGICRRVRGTSV
jgi:hypothetical protein